MSTLKSKDYWKDLLSNATTKLELPTDLPRPSIQGLRQSIETFPLPNELVERLQAVAEQEQASLHVTLGAVFCILLRRYSGQDDLLVASPILRSVPEAESTAAANTVVLRARFSEDMTFRAFLNHVHEGAVAASMYGETPFEALVAQYAREFDPSHAPLCQVAFNFFEPQDDALAPIQIADVLNAANAHYDLSLFVTRNDDGFTGRLAYNPELYLPETMRRFCGHYQVLLESVSLDPDQDVSTLPVLTQSERKLILEDWNETRVDYPNVCAHCLIEQRAALHPGAIALVFGERRVTYGELNERSNQVARYLRKRGVDRDVLVGVCLERSPELVIALLAVWKAGGAYIPLDPTNPPDRLQYMLSDSAARILLTNTRQQHLFPETTEIGIYIDADWSTFAGEDSANLDVDVDPLNLSYVMYTSGSTGKPKGAMILHGGLTNYLCWAADEYTADQGEAVPVHSSIAFDLTVTALWVPLAAGGQIELLVEDVGGQNLLTAIRNQKDRSLVKITPAHLAILAEQLGPEKAADCSRVFVIGGENLTAESLQLWRDRSPNTRLINEYGPTETVVGCCVYEVKSDDPHNGSIPIGRPIANTQLYVLDRMMNPVPCGVAGELFIGGAGVARGYWNRPELTEDRFVPNPFSTDTNSRLYKTGDIARYRPDGVLEYLGRVDNQVKIRGYRIELGEIETRLADQPGVKASAVLAREDSPGNKLLVAYIVLHQPTSLTVEDLRGALRSELPDYMIPSHFVFLNAMPLTGNGKVDRRALPAPSIQRTIATTTRPPVSTETESKLIEIWRDLLGVDQVGVNDNFFELGGHSLLAMKVVSRIRDAFGVDLSPQAVIDDQTIAALARIITEVSKPAVKAVVGTGPFFFGDPQLYGVYHGAASATQCETALLVCPSIGHEHTRAHRAIKLLCEAAARAGVPSLRFDYSGLGNSAGDFPDQSVDVWCKDILRATDELLTRSGAQSVVVVGCRLGAALAAAAFQELNYPVQSLLLWDPVISGEDFLHTAGTFQDRFLKDAGRFNREVIDERMSNPESIVEDDCVGYRYPRALRQSLESLNLRRIDAWPTLPIHAIFSESSAEWESFSELLAMSGRRVSTELVHGAPGAWEDYAIHEKTLRAGPLISHIVDFISRVHS